MEYKIIIPKKEQLAEFSLYVIGEEGDLYESLTREESFEFSTNELVVDVFSQESIEQDLNELTNKIFKFETLRAISSSFLESLKKEEGIYQAGRYGNIQELSERKLKTETEKSQFLLATSLDDPIIVALWNYIARAKNDLDKVSFCYNAYKNHLFKCKDFYNIRYGKTKGYQKDDA